MESRVNHSIPSSLPRYAGTPTATRLVFDLIAAARRADGVVLVGIGGHGAAGKTTLANLIREAQIVSTDEFWDGAGFDLERLLDEVIRPLSQGLPARFASYDWPAHETRGTRTVEAVGVVVIEGVCALHRILRDAYAVRIWVEAPYQARLARAVARDGEAARSTWVDVWMPSEDRYIARDEPASCAHLVVHN